VVSNCIVIILELVDQVSYLWTLDFNDERVRKLHMLGRNDKVVSLWDKHLNVVDSIAQVVISIVKGFFFDNLVGSIVRCLHVILISVSLFFIVASCHWGWRLVSLADDKVRLRICILGHQRIFTDVFQHLFSLNFLSLPCGHVVISLLILEALENELIFFGNFHKFSFTCITV